MINIKKISIVIFLFLQSCMEPDTEKLWDISIENIFETKGFARSVIVEGSRAYVAAGQSGTQIWDLEENTLLKDFTGYEEGGTFLEFQDLALIGRDSVNSLLFLSESNQDVKIFHLDETDSLIYRNTIMSARTKDFVSFLGSNSLSGSKMTIVVSEVDKNLELASRNVQDIKVVKASSCSVADLLNNDTLLLDANALTLISERFGDKK